MSLGLADNVISIKNLKICWLPTKQYQNQLEERELFKKGELP